MLQSHQLMMVSEILKKKTRFIFRKRLITLTLDSRGNDIYMTPEDLVRSLNPSADLQPDNLLLDQYRKIKTNQVGNF